MATYCRRIVGFGLHSVRNGAMQCLTKRTLHSSAVQKHWLDARDKDLEQKEKSLIVKQGNIFDEAAKKSRDKATFHNAVNMYLLKNQKYKRGSVEFIYAAMDYMEKFGVHKDLHTYKKLLSIMPKHTMVARSVWQGEFQHYPKQQQCITDLMEKMGYHGLIPDDKFGYMLEDVFGKKTHVFFKYQRMMYWMPKFKNANPYPVPYELPNDACELAVLALKRMAVDVQNTITVFKTSELKAANDDTFIVSACSPTQQELLEKMDPKKALFVEGGHSVWMREKNLVYFTLKAEVSDTLKLCKEKEPEKADENKMFNWSYFGTTEEPASLIPLPTIHEQDDGTILAMCITGTSSLDSLRSWISFLQHDNPQLKQIPCVFTLITPEEGLAVYEDQQKKHDDSKAT